MPEGMTDDRKPSVDEEISLARAAIAGGDVHRAADHLANVIAAAPTQPEAHQILAQLAAHRQATGAELYPLDGPVSVGAVVARAHLLASAGEYEEALDLLAAASAHAPTADWAGLPWVADPELPGRLAPDALARVLNTVCAGPPANGVLPEHQRPPLRPYLLLARHAVRAYPAHPSLLGAAATLARRLGDTALAIDWARQASQIQPAQVTEVWLGYAYRDAGRTAEALEAFQRALAYEPTNLSVYADIAYTLAGAGRLDEALSWADRAVVSNPTDHCAVHAAYQLRFQYDGSVAHLIGLSDFARAYPTDVHEHSELADSCAGRAWLGQVPRTGTAEALLRRLLAADQPPLPGQLMLDLLEPPSAMATLQRALPGVELRIQRLLPPDIRTPRRAVGLRLWTFDGTTPVAAVPPPSPTGAAILAELAHPTWPHPVAAYHQAARLAPVPTADLLGALAHPPGPPPGGAQALARQDPARWVRSVQVWACLGLLHQGADEPWGPSARRRTLVDLTFGVEDWATEAALFAMITAAWVDPTVRSDVAALVRERLADVADVAAHRPVTIAWSLARLALMTPDLASDATRLAWEIVAAEEMADEAPEAPAQGLVRRLFSARRPKA